MPSITGYRCLLVMMPLMEELTNGLWRWTARHPEWHPGEFGAEVAGFAAKAGDTTLLIDPLLPTDPSSVLAVIDDTVGDRLAILITVPYHVRSAEELWKRYAMDAETTIHGHPAAAKHPTSAPNSPGCHSGWRAVQRQSPFVSCSMSGS